MKFELGTILNNKMIIVDYIENPEFALVGVYVCLNIDKQLIQMNGKYSHFNHEHLEKFFVVTGYSKMSKILYMKKHTNENA